MLIKTRGNLDDFLDLRKNEDIFSPNSEILVDILTLIASAMYSNWLRCSSCKGKEEPFRGPKDEGGSEQLAGSRIEGESIIFCVVGFQLKLLISENSIKNN